MRSTCLNDSQWSGFSALLALAGAICLGTPLIAAPPQVDIATIRETWQKRQDAVRSFKCVSTNQAFDAKEWRQAAASRPSLIPSKLAARDQVELQYEFTHVLIVDGMKMRIESDAPVLLGFGSNTLRKEQYTSVYDGNSQTALQNPANVTEGGEFWQANLRGSNETDRDETAVMPLLVTFRGNDIEHGSTFTDFDLRNHVVTRELGEIDGHSCVVLRHGRQYLWLDPQRDFVMLRLLLMKPDMQGILFQGDVSYREHNEAGWIPTEWHYAYLMPDGRLASMYAGEVKSIEINPTLAAETFTIRIPPGAVIYDTREDPRKLIVSVQLGDGVRVEVPPGGTYSELVSRAKAIRSAERAQSPRYWWYIGGLLAAALIALAYMRARSFYWHRT